MSRALLTLVAVPVLCLAALHAAVQAGANDPEIVFDPPLAVAIRQTNGSPARGDILSMNEQDLLLRTVSGKEVRIKLERVRSIKTANEKFEYWPSDESFTDLCRRVDAVPGAALMGDVPAPDRGARPSTQNRTTPEEDESREQRERRRRMTSAPPRIGSGDILPKARPGLVKSQARRAGAAEDVRTQARPPRGLQRGESADDETPAGERTQDEAAAPGTAVYSCSNCGKDLPLSIRSGDACPHCGKVVVFEGESAETAATQTPAPVRDPFRANGPATTPAIAPVTPPAAAVPGTTGGTGLADMPLLAKVGIFIGFVVVGWFVLQRR